MDDSDAIEAPGHLAAVAIAATSRRSLPAQILTHPATGITVSEGTTMAEVTVGATTAADMEAVVTLAAETAVVGVEMEEAIDANAAVHMHKHRKLPHPDSLHVLAAQGWLELGNHLEAKEELEKIAVSLRSHPDVLEVLWPISAKAGKWEVCLDLAQALIEIAPDRPSGWVNLAVAHHKQGRTQVAWETLLPLADRFPKAAPIYYDLACYACQLGNLPRAKKLLNKAFRLDKSDRLRSLALNDPDLEPLWKSIKEI